MAAPKREQFANNATNVLSVAIDNVVTSLAVASATGFPTAGNFRILIDSEIMLVTAVSGTTFTVARGQEGTTAASHSDLVTVTHLLTKESVNRLIKDDVPYGQEASRPPLGLYDANGNAVDSSDFTWVNQSTAVVTDHDGIMSVDACSGGSGTHFIRGLFMAVPATPWSVVACVQGLVLGNTADAKFGIALRESSTGKLTTWECSRSFRIENWTSPTASSSTVQSTTGILPTMIWLKLRDDGTNIKFYFGTNGIDFYENHSVARTSFLAGGADQVGVHVNRFNNVSYKVFMDVLHWSFGS